MKKSRGEILNESLEWWTLMLQAADRRHALKLLDQLITMNRAFHADADTWQEFQDRLQRQIQIPDSDL